MIDKKWIFTFSLLISASFAIMTIDSSEEQMAQADRSAEDLFNLHVASGKGNQGINSRFAKVLRLAASELDKIADGTKGNINAFIEKLKTLDLDEDLSYKLEKTVERAAKVAQDKRNTYYQTVLRILSKLADRLQAPEVRAPEQAIPEAGPTEAELNAMKAPVPTQKQVTLEQADLSEEEVKNAKMAADKLFDLYLAERTAEKDMLLTNALYNALDELGDIALSRGERGDITAFLFKLKSAQFGDDLINALEKMAQKAASAAKKKQNDSYYLLVKRVFESVRKRIISEPAQKNTVEKLEVSPEEIQQANNIAQAIFNRYKGILQSNPFVRALILTALNDFAKSKSGMKELQMFKKALEERAEDLKGIYLGEELGNFIQKAEQRFIKNPSDNYYAIVAQLLLGLRALLLLPEEIQQANAIAQNIFNRYKGILQSRPFVRAFILTALNDFAKSKSGMKELQAFKKVLKARSDDFKGVSLGEELENFIFEAEQRLTKNPSDNYYKIVAQLLLSLRALLLQEDSAPLIRRQAEKPALPPRPIRQRVTQKPSLPARPAKYSSGLVRSA